MEITVPEQVVRSSGIKANFMCDTAVYLLGFSGAGDKADKKAAQKFEAAKELHLSLLSGVDSEAARTICNFFETYAPESIAKRELPDKVSEELMKELVTFTDENSNYLMADPAIAAAWNRSREKDTDAVSGRCLVTGNTDEIAILHNKIKGVQGAQSSGANLVGFNARAYESYGKDNGQGLNAPGGKYAMYAYTSALNSLLDFRNHHRTRVGDTTVVWWTLDADEEAESFMDALISGNDDDAALTRTVENISRGKPIGIDESKLEKTFCILGLAPNAARISVRFFYCDTFGRFIKNIAAHPDGFVEKSVTGAAEFGKTVVYLEQVRMRFVRICRHPPRGGRTITQFRPPFCHSPRGGCGLKSAIGISSRSLVSSPSVMRVTVEIRIRESDCSPGRATIRSMMCVKMRPH